MQSLWSSIESYRAPGFRRLRRRIGKELRTQAILSAWAQRRLLKHGRHEGIKLKAVGIRVAFQKERQHRVADGAGSIRMLDRGGAVVGGRKQTQAPMPLDTLVKAVGGTPRTGDLRGPPCGGLGDHCGGFD